MRIREVLGRAEVAVGLFGVVVVAVVSGAAIHAFRTLSSELPLAGVTQDIELRLGLSHLWLEEHVRGDASVDVDVQVYGNLDEARRLCQAMLDGGRTGFGRIAAETDHVRRSGTERLCRGIDDFRAMTTARLAGVSPAGTESPADTSYHAAFGRLLAMTDRHVEELERDVRHDQSRLRRAGAVAVAVLTGLFALVAVLVRRSRRAAEAAAAESSRRHDDQARLATIVQGSADAIISLTLDGRVLTWNAGAEAMFGYTAEEMTGEPISRLAPPELTTDQGELLRQVREGNAVKHLEAVRVRKDGSHLTAALTISPMYQEGNGVVAMSAIVRDISDAKALEESLQRRAFYDELTQLPNRSLLHDRLVHGMERAARSGRPPAVILLDLDNFKAINDSLGHSVGDDVLVDVARRLQHVVRPMDTVARLGGDEFVVLVEDPLPGAAIGAAQRVLEALRLPADVAGHDIVLQASAGVALGSVGQDPDELLGNADAAMYVAKGRGKGHWQVFEPEMHRAVLDRLELTVDLAGAAARGELFVVYQPIVDLTTGCPVGAEALVRWNHPTRGLVSPLDFISIAEESGQISDIGAHVLREALGQLARCQEHQPSFYVTVNVSPIQFRRPNFVTLVDSALTEAGVDPNRLVLEITETGLMTDVEDNVATLEELRRRGVRIAIDDFGTGYSSIAYLKRLPVDIVKIDKSLVDGVASDPGVWALAQAILGLVAAVGLDTVAEGIEAPAQVAHLEALGCQLGQGYHFARPMPADELTGLVAGSEALPHLA